MAPNISSFGMSLQGTFTRTLPAGSQRPFGATKWCVFNRTEITASRVADAVDERCARMQTTSIDLLQVCRIISVTCDLHLPP